MNYDDTAPLGERRAMVMATLAEINALLGELVDSAGTRALRSKARSFENAVLAWNTVSPTAAQLAAMLDLVSELHAKAKEAHKRLDASVARSTGNPPSSAGSRTDRPKR